LGFVFKDFSLWSFTAPMAIQGISSAMGYGLYGVRRSLDNFESAANDVVRSSSEAFDTVQFSSAALAKAGAAQGPEPSLVRGLVDMGVAKVDLAANVRVIQTAQETDEVLWRIGAPR